MKKKLYILLIIFNQALNGKIFTLYDQQMEQSPYIKKEKFISPLAWDNAGYYRNFHQGPEHKVNNKNKKNVSKKKQNNIKKNNKKGKKK